MPILVTFSRQCIYRYVVSCAGSDNHELTSDRVDLKNIDIQDYLLTYYLGLLRPGATWASLGLLGPDWFKTGTA